MAYAAPRHVDDVGRDRFMRRAAVRSITFRAAALDARPSQREYVLAGSVLLVVLALRLAYVFSFRIDTDEPQHLHIVWAWTQGLLPYRDVFDNHAPLFHMMLAPFAAAFGEDPAIIAWMRVAMIPISGFTLWCTYLLSRTTFGESVGVWAAVWLAACPRFFLTSVEFRADTLWAALWLASLTVLLAGRLEPWRGLAGGFLLGADLAVSLKTGLCIAALAIATGVVRLVVPRPSGVEARTLRRFTVAAVLGTSIVPLAVMLFFATKGALTPFLYGTITHNVLPGLQLGMGWPLRLLTLAAFVPLCWLGARVCFVTARSHGEAARRMALFLAGAVYIALLESLWPVETKQDYQVALPILLVFVAALGVLAGRAAVRSRPRWRLRAGLVPYALTLVALAQIGVLLEVAPVAGGPIRVDPDLIADVLRLTRPGDEVMDLKGETVFRPRPFFYALETFTRERLERGLLADTISERLITTATHVAVPDSDRLPPRARAFLRDHYLSVGRLRVAGRMLTTSPSRARTGIVFHVEIPAPYAVASAAGTAHGELDGERYDGPRALTTGRHVFRTKADEGPLALVWAPTLERGFSPFAARAADPGMVPSS